MVGMNRRPYSIRKLAYCESLLFYWTASLWALSNCIDLVAQLRWYIGEQSPEFSAFLADRHLHTHYGPLCILSKYWHRDN